MVAILADAPSTIEWDRAAEEVRVRALEQQTRTQAAARSIRCTVLSRSIRYAVCTCRCPKLHQLDELRALMDQLVE